MPTLYSIPELSTLNNVSEEVLYRWAAEGLLRPFAKIGRGYRYREADFEAACRASLEPKQPPMKLRRYNTDDFAEALRMCGINPDGAKKRGRAKTKNRRAV